MFFCGAHNMKLDSKGRFVLPSEFRYGLVHEGKLEFAVTLGFGGSLTIYKAPVIHDMMQKMAPFQFAPDLQSFFTTFFGSLQLTTCDKLGRVKLSSQLKQVLGKKEKEIVVVGVFDKIEIWPKTLYDKNMEKMMQSEVLSSNMERAFSIMNTTASDAGAGGTPGNTPGGTPGNTPGRVYGESKEFEGINLGANPGINPGINPEINPGAVSDTTSDTTSENIPDNTPKGTPKDSMVNINDILS